MSVLTIRKHILLCVLMMTYRHGGHVIEGLHAPLQAPAHDLRHVLDNGADVHAVGDIDRAAHRQGLTPRSGRE